MEVGDPDLGNFKTYDGLKPTKTKNSKTIQVEIKK